MKINNPKNKSFRFRNGNPEDGNPKSGYVNKHPPSEFYAFSHQFLPKNIFTGLPSPGNETLKKHRKNCRNKKATYYSGFVNHFEYFQST